MLQRDSTRERERATDRDSRRGRGRQRQRQPQRQTRQRQRQRQGDTCRRECFTRRLSVLVRPCSCGQQLPSLGKSSCRRGTKEMCTKGQVYTTPSHAKGPQCCTHDASWLMMMMMMEGGGCLRILASDVMGNCRQSDSRQRHARLQFDGEDVHTTLRAGTISGRMTRLGRRDMSLLPGPVGRSSKSKVREGLFDAI